MKKLLYTLCLLVFSVSLCTAQKTNKNPENAETPRKTSKETKQSDKKSSSENTDVLSMGATLQTQLQQTLDVRNSQVGDEVILKVNKTIKQDGEVIVSKGSKLIGRVTEVQQKTKNTGMSKLGIVFDRIEGKTLNTPINAAITSIFQTQSAVSANNDLFDTSAAASGNSTASSGGLLGSGGLDKTVGGVVDTTTNTVGSVANTAGNTVGNTTQNLGGALRGVQLSNSASGSSNSSATLSSMDKNIKLEKGLTFQVFVSNSQ